jgi:dipeptidyl aminopeptidase/acylaminoacyl peptidase
MIPAWIQGMRTIAWSADGQSVYAIRSKNAFYSMWRYDVSSGDGQPVAAFDAYTHIKQIAVSARGQTAAIGSAATIPPRVLSSTSDDTSRIWRRAAVEALDDSQLADVEAITWQGHDGEDVHGLYYAPHNPDYTADGAPPLIVRPHSGPTSQQSAEYDDEAQFFATRGYALLYVNYRGSTGYGKAYMNKHAGSWGVYDVQDCITGAQHLVNAGKADADKLVIMGSSAGGFTVLQALVEEPGFFKAGIVSYGVSDQFALAQDTHKFEERYSEWLLGSLPEAADIYRERSPLLHAERISDPLLVFQGGDDHVVPQSQSDDLVNALRRNGTPHEYRVYDDEGHGFRQPETIKDFYQRIEKFLLKYVIYA